MSLTAEQVQRIAHLARLAVPEQQLEEHAANLSRILELVEQMNSVNTDTVEPLAHPLEMTQRLRNDEVTAGNQRETFQQQAPAVEQGLFLVPRVIE